MWKKVLGMVIFCLFFTGVDIYANSVVSLPPMKEAPQIDGVIKPGEWREATGFSGFQWGGTLEPRKGWAYLGYDRTHLYIAVRTEMPPDGKLVTRARRKGGHVVLDDSIELWIVPPAEGRPYGPRGKGYFQLIVNQAGTIYDRHWDPGYGLSPQAWNVKMAMANKVSPDGFWEMEIAIPLKEFGIDKLVLPSEWRINVVRNWKNPWSQANLTSSTSFSDIENMVRMRFDPDVPVIQIRSLGKLTLGKPILTVAATDPLARSVDLNLEVVLKAEETSILEEKQKFTLKPGKEEVFRFDPIFTSPDHNLLSVTVTDGATGKRVYHRSFEFAAAPKHRWTVLDEFLTFSLSFDNENLRAEKSKGNPDPIDIKGETSFIEGVKGKALFLKTTGTQITYDNVGNLSIPGAVSFWVQLHRDRISGKPPYPGEFTFFWWTRLIKGSGYVGIQDSNYRQLLLWLHYFPEMKKYRNVYAPFPWQKERWFHILANLGEEKVELFLDGHRIAKATLERKLKTEELAPFNFGFWGETQFAIDEVRIFSRPLTAAEVERIAMGEEPLDGRITYFPSLNSLVVEALIEPEAMEEETALNLIVTDADEKKVFLNHSFKREDWKLTSVGTLRLREVVILPELKEATYRTWLQEVKKGGLKDGRRFLSRHFVVRRFEWENNTLGKSDVIIPPFTPLEVSGNKVKSILRTHYLGNMSLWQQVESLGKEILARPIALNAISNGKKLSWRHQPVRIVESKPHRVRMEALSTNSLMEVESVAEFDYDGLMMVTLTITPRAKQPLDRLWLEIPVKKEIATLFHAVGESARANPGGNIPTGKGVIWGSRSIHQPNIDNFIPYIWVGSEERGICWVADWDKDWVHSQKRSAIELLREKDGTVLILANFINGPITLTRPRTITFALQASPVKPMPENWRNLVFDFGWPGTGRFEILWPPSWGAHYSWASRYPLDKDFTYVHKLAETKRTGKIDREFIDKWVKRVMEHPGDLAHRPSESYVRLHVELAFWRAKGLFQREPPGKLIWYSVARECTKLLPEHEVYGDEWQFRKMMHSSASFRDYAVWYANKMMEAGMEAIYVDETFSAAKFTWPTGEAYNDEDGEVRPSLGVLSRLRPLIRRLAVMMYEKGREPFVYVHQTNANILPMVSFAQASLGWEWKYGGSDFQERFTPAYIRAVNIGRQAGTIPTVLCGITGIDEKEELLRLTRTALALALPHEMFFHVVAMHGPTAIKAREIITGFLSGEDIEAYPYWENQDLLKVQGNLLVTAYRDKNKILLVIGNMGEAGDYVIEFKNEKLNLGKIQMAKDRETGESITVRGNAITLSIEKHDFALVEISFK